MSIGTKPFLPPGLVNFMKFAKNKEKGDIYCFQLMLHSRSLKCQNTHILHQKVFFLIKLCYYQCKIALKTLCTKEIIKKRECFRCVVLTHILLQNAQDVGNFKQNFKNTFATKISFLVRLKTSK